LRRNGGPKSYGYHINEILNDGANDIEHEPLRQFIREMELAGNDMSKPKRVVCKSLIAAALVVKENEELTLEDVQESKPRRSRKSQGVVKEVVPISGERLSKQAAEEGNFRSPEEQMVESKPARRSRNSLKVVDYADMEEAVADEEMDEEEFIPDVDDVDVDILGKEEDGVLIDVGSDRLEVEQVEELMIEDDIPRPGLLAGEMIIMDDESRVGNERSVEQGAPTMLQGETIPPIVCSTGDPDKGSLI
jgi:hypothetical protein